MRTRFLTILVMTFITVVKATTAFAAHPLITDDVPISE
jgi:hypothetical protein